MGSLGMPEILMILVIALIIFGPRKLPELGKTLGQSLAQFRKASEDFKRQWEDEVELEKRRLDAPPVPPPVERPNDTGPDTASVEEYGTSELEQPAEVSATEQEPTTEQETVTEQEIVAEQEPVTVPRSENTVEETKRDWM
jgi:sec-independent protein translocase protein TatA